MYIYQLIAILLKTLRNLPQPVGLPKGIFYILQGPKYNWDPQTQGLILGAFYYGNVIAQLPAGLLSEKVGAKWVFGGCVLNTAIFNLLTPFITSWSSVAFIVVRIIVGFGEV